MTPMNPHVFHVRYQTWAALHRDCQQQIEHNGLLVRTDEQFSLYAVAEVRLCTPDEIEFVLAGQVVQDIPGQGLAVQFDDAAAPTIEDLRLKCFENPVPAGETPAADDPLVAAEDEGSAGSTPAPEAEPEPDADRPRRVVDMAGLRKKLEGMSVNEKRREALHGKRDARLLLIRDRNKTIHPFVLRNPAITLDEIEQIAKMPTVNPDVLREIAKNREWSRSVTVCRNLVRNPKMPVREAVGLLSKLPLSDVRALAKSGNVRTPIQQAARKKVIS